MSVLRNIESKLADLVEGTFGRVFRSEVRPVELARGLAKEMDEHRTVSLSKTYVPNEYLVYLSPDDRARFEAVEHEVVGELAGYLLEHARRERLAPVSRPHLEFRTAQAPPPPHPRAPPPRGARGGWGGAGGPPGGGARPGGGGPPPGPGVVPPPPR